MVPYLCRRQKGKWRPQIVLLLSRAFCPQTLWMNSVCYHPMQNILYHAWLSEFMKKVLCPFKYDDNRNFRTYDGSKILNTPNLIRSFPMKTEKSALFATNESWLVCKIVKDSIIILLLWSLDPRHRAGKKRCQSKCLTLIIHHQNSNKIVQWIYDHNAPEVEFEYVRNIIIIIIIISGGIFQLDSLTVGYL